MCCKTPCSVARCNGCPETNWNAFSWRLDSPASELSMMWGTIQRRFVESHNVMRYPGVCPCLWISYLGDVGRDTAGTYNPATQWHNIACSWVLTRQLVGQLWTWKMTCYRYGWDWVYYESIYGAGSWNGWHWNEFGPGGYGHCQDGLGDAYQGYPGYGYGWGGYGWGFGFDPAYWSIGGGMATEYILQGSFNCKGTNRFIRDDSRYLAEPLYVAGSWPAFVDVTRVPLMRRVPAT